MKLALFQLALLVLFVVGMAIAYGPSILVVAVVVALFSLFA